MVLCKNSIVCNVKHSLNYNISMLTLRFYYELYIIIDLLLKDNAFIEFFVFN